MKAIKEVTSTTAITSEADHQIHTKPTQRIRLLRKSNNERKGYLYACTNGSDRFHVGFSLCHDDKFSGAKGIEIAKKRAKRNSKLDSFIISNYIDGHISNIEGYVVIPESIVEQLDNFIDYCKGVFELKPPEWADGIGINV